jgi:putative PEP-CTERM system TPR-repeat lipoprotein
MKNLIKHQYGLILLLLATLASQSQAANFDVLDQPTSQFGDLEQVSPESTGSASILNSLQQSELDSKKDRYFAVLDLLKQNKLDEAASKIKTLLQQSPQESQFYNLQALLATLQKNSQAARQNYQKALELDKNNLAAHLGLAKLALDTGDLAKAKQHAQQALSINNQLTSAYLILADVAYKQKNFTEAEQILQDGYNKVKGNLNQEMDIINTLGRYYVMQKQSAKLLALAETVVKGHPQATKALVILAGAQIANNKNEAAEQTLRQIIVKDSQDLNSRLLLVKLLSNKPGQEVEVLRLLDETAKIDTNNPQADIYKAAYLIKLKRYEEALVVAAKVEAKLPKLAIGKLLKGDVFLANQQWDKAINEYQQVYKIEPNINVLFKIADIMQAQGKGNEAATLLETEAVKSDNNLPLHFKLATLYQQQNNVVKAQSHYEAILGQQADNALALNNLAWLYWQQNNPKSLALAQKAHTLAPDVAAITDTYGYILLKQGQTKEAIAMLEQATTAAPQDNDMQFHLAEAWLASDEKDKAISILETIVASRQQFQEKAAAEKLLAGLKSQ